MDPFTARNHLSRGHLRFCYLGYTIFRTFFFFDTFSLRPVVFVLVQEPRSAEPTMIHCQFSRAQSLCCIVCTVHLIWDMAPLPGVRRLMDLWYSVCNESHVPSWLTLNPANNISIVCLQCEVLERNLWQLCNFSWQSQSQHCSHEQ